MHTGRLEDILKDPPAKYSLRRKGLCLKPIPPLDVVRNGDSSCVDREGGSVGGGYQPGLNEMGSLKRDGNMIPLSYQRTHNFSSEGWRGTHTHNFRYIHVHCMYMYI